MIPDIATRRTDNWVDWLNTAAAIEVSWGRRGYCLVPPGGFFGGPCRLGSCWLPSVGVKVDLAGLWAGRGGFVGFTVGVHGCSPFSCCAFRRRCWPLLGNDIVSRWVLPSKEKHNPPRRPE
ncbi:unnamed protein product [Ectocarpus sp. 4 AP-2014]